VACALWIAVLLGPSPDPQGHSAAGVDELQSAEGALPCVALGLFGICLLSTTTPWPTEHTGKIWADRESCGWTKLPAGAS
jgi:hypothetical protein